MQPCGRETPTCRLEVCAQGDLVLIGRFAGGLRLSAEYMHPPTFQLGCPASDAMLRVGPQPRIITHRFLQIDFCPLHRGILCSSCRDTTPRYVAPPIPHSKRCGGTAVMLHTVDSGSTGVGSVSGTRIWLLLTNNVQVAVVRSMGRR